MEEFLDEKTRLDALTGDSAKTSFMAADGEGAFVSPISICNRGLRCDQILRSVALCGR